MPNWRHFYWRTSYFTYVSII